VTSHCTAYDLGRYGSYQSEKGKTGGMLALIGLNPPPAKWVKKKCSPLITNIRLILVRPNDGSGPRLIVFRRSIAR
jgi:hypothetical protein